MIKDLNVGGATQVVVNQVVEGEIREEGTGEIRVEGVENIDFNPLSLSIEFDVNLPINKEDLVNVPSNLEN